MSHKLLSDIFVDDNFNQLDKSKWTVSGDAGPDSTDRHITLTNPEVNSEGRLTLRGGLDKDVWYMNANFVLSDPSTNPAEAFAVWFYSDTDSIGYQPCCGYGVEFDHLNDVVKLVDVRDNTRVVLSSSNIGIKDNSTGLPRINTVTIQWSNGRLQVNINNNSAINYQFEFDDLNTENKGFMFSAKTGSSEFVEHAVDDVRIVTPSKRIFNEALNQFDNNGIYTGPASNTRRVMRTLLGGIESLAVDARDIEDAHHIRTAHGRQLDRIGRLVRVRRKENENDKKFRLRIILAFRLNSSTGTFDEFAQFMGVLLDVDPANLDYNFNPDALPCTMTVAGDSELFRASPLTNTEIIEFASQTIEAGHRVLVEESGTFVLIEDGDVVNDTDTGLTGDSNLNEGGTLSGDL